MTSPRFASTDPPKATLFCPDCDHRSPVDGDWVVRSRDECVDYECPECGTTITSRPSASESAADGRSDSLLRCADD